MPPGKKDGDSLKNPLPSMLEDANKPSAAPVNPDSTVIASSTAPKMDSVVKNQRNRVRPLLEGINTPVSGFKTSEEPSVSKPAENGNLTEAENKLISETNDFKAPEPMLMPKFAAESAARSKHRIKTPIIVGLVLLIVIAGGYEAYSWKIGKSLAPVTITHKTYVPVQGTDAPVASSTIPTTNGSLGATSSTTPASSTPVAVALTLKINSTPTGFLNVRSTPSSSGSLITKVHPGETYTYVTSKNSWYEIMLPSNQLGWVSGQYITIMK